MFFPRLRRRAKWVFVFLAAAFGLGFVAFGVGTGVQGANIGDALQDFFGGAEGPSIDDAQEKLAKNPQDAEAQLELAQAYIAANDPDRAITAYETYRMLAPKDTAALQQLASLYEGKAIEAQRRAAVAQEESQSANFGRSLIAADSPLSQALNDPVAQAVQQEASERQSAAQSAAQAAFAKQSAVYQELTLLEPDNVLLFAQLGNAATSAADYDAGVAAYLRFLELAPDDPNTLSVLNGLLFAAQGAEFAGDTETAIKAYEAYLEQAPEEDESRTAVEERLKSLKQSGGQGG